jgi:tol-pal system protein YbgF
MVRVARAQRVQPPSLPGAFQKASLMIWRSFLPQPRPTLLLVLLSMAAASPAVRAQDASTQERLDRLERDLSMLQRQVYRGTGGEAPPGAESGTSTAVDLQVRMDRLEQQMRDLTGRVEDETNQVQQLRQRLEQVNSDIDVRLGEGRGKDAGATPPAGAQASEPPPLAQPAAMTPYGRPPPPSYGTLTPPGEPPAPDSGAEPPYPGPTQLTPRIAGAGDALRPRGSDAMPPASASAQYNSAFGLLRKADYPAAEEALRSFIQQHPRDPLAGNAQYWLGESFYARGQYSEAAAAFADGYKRYPRGPKAADGLLKLGMSLARANQKHNACIALMQLDRDFPHPGSAIKDRATQEKKKLGC